MNKEHLLFQLKEAQEALEQLVRECETSPEFFEGELFLSLQHIYHHINTAWNARNISNAALDQASDQNFKNWGSFPTDLIPLLV